MILFCAGSIDGEAMAPSITADSIKSEPGHDPDDYIESNAAAIKRQKCNVNIKEEESRLETEYEFFSVGGGSSQNDIDSQEHYPITDTAVSSSDESDSSCNLTDFLKLCESSRDTSTAEEICIQAAPQPSKRKEDTGNAKPKISLRRNIASSALPISREIKEELINEEVSLMETSDISNSLRYKETGAAIKEEVSIDMLDQDILIIDSEDCQLPTEEDNTGDQSTMSIAQVVDDADLVPSNAFSVKENNNDFRTKLVSTPFQVKEEPMEWGKPASTNTSNHSDSSEHRKVTTETKLNKTKSNSGTKVILKRKSLVAVAPVETNKRKPIVLSSPNDDDDDDKVPINNALCSRQRSLACFDLTLDDEPPRITIKSELETEDLFLLPKNVQSSRKETSDKNLTLKQKENTNIQNLNRKVSRSLRNGTSSKKTNPEHSDGHDTDDGMYYNTSRKLTVVFLKNYEMI